MREIHGGRVAARQLRAAGIDTVFGVVAGPMIELFAGAQAEGLRVVGCRHEENAAFMASAWGFRRRLPGVVIAGSGPGMSNTLTPLYVATASAMPLVVLGGSAYSETTGIGGFQELDQALLAAPACKWTGRVDRTERIPEWLHLALGQAAEGRPGGVYLDFPGEVMARRLPADAVPLRQRAPDVARPGPAPDAVTRIADWLAGAERPLLLLGKGAAWADAGPALARLVARGLPYVASPMARGVIPDDDPRFANAARSAALSRADVVVMIGGRFNWIFGFGRPPRFSASARVAQVDVAPEAFRSAADVELGVVADAAAAAEALDRALDGRTLACVGSGWLEELRGAGAANEARLRPSLESDAVPIHPYRLVAELRRVLPRDASIAVDGETIMGICRAVLPSFVSRSRLNAGTTGCMGTGLPYAIGSALAAPEHPSLAVLGDYAFGAAAMAFETAARVGARVVVVVANNEGIAGHLIQDHMLPPGAPPIASLLPARYDRIAEMVGAHAEHVERPEAIRPALERALAVTSGPSLVHVKLDPKAVRIGGGNYLK